jgi:hypothetical protein
MMAHHRGHFLAFALLPLLNTLGLLVHGLNLSTHGTGNTGRALVIILVSALISVISVAVSSFKRARHLGYAPRTAALGLLACLFLGPFVLLGFLYLSVAKPRVVDSAQTTPPAASLGAGWLWAPVLLLGPWAAILVASAIP